MINKSINSNYNVIKKFYICPHHPTKGVGKYKKKCGCRKPKNGLILNAKDKYDLNLNQSFVIGDRWRDMDAAENSNCKSVFIDHHYSEKHPSKYKFSFENIDDAMRFIIGSCNE